MRSLHFEWHRLKRGQPGRRFQDGYEHARRTRAGATITGRIVRLTLALVAIAIGVVLMFIPGPAILFFLLAGGLLAAESRRVARWLDRAELAIRAVAKIALHRWCSLPMGGKAVVVVAGVILSGGFMFFTWQMMFG